MKKTKLSIKFNLITSKKKSLYLILFLLKYNIRQGNLGDLFLIEFKI